MQYFSCGKAAFSSVNEVDIQKCQKWLTNGENKPGYTALTDKEIAAAVNKLEHEDDKDISKLALPSHDKAFVCLLTCIMRWLEA